MAGRSAQPLRRRRPQLRRYLQPRTAIQTGFAKNGLGGASTTATSVTLGSATTSGGTLLVAVAGYWNSNNFAAGDVADNKGNTFAFDFEVATGVGEACVAFYSCSGFAGGASHQITVTNSNVIGKCIGVVEYGATVAFDKSASDVDDTTSPHTSGTTATLTQQPGIAMAAIGIDTGVLAALTPDGDWLQIGESEDGANDLVCNMVYKFLNATTAEDAGWTWAGSYAGNGVQAGIVTYYDFTPAGTPPGRPRQTRRMVAVSARKRAS
jgi:hypothetical protein